MSADVEDVGFLPRPWVLRVRPAAAAALFLPGECRIVDPLPLAAPGETIDA